MENNKALVLGIGSDILSDEGIGIRLIHLLKKTNISLIADFITLNIGSPELIEIIKNYKKVFIIDAIKTKTKPVGEIHCIDLKNFQNTINLSNPHDISFIDTINLGKLLYKNFSPKIFIYAIEIENEFEISNDLSEQLFSKITDIADNIVYHIQNELINKKNIKYKRIQYENF